MDCLSRNCGNITEENVELIQEQKEDIVKKVHIDLLHRGIKSIIYELKRRNFKFEDEYAIVKKVLSKCDICKKFNSKKSKKFVFVTAYERGEKVAVDIIGPIGNSYIITGIDFFTRKGYATVVNSRKEENV